MLFKNTHTKSIRQMLLLLFGLFFCDECRAGLAISDTRSRRLSEALHELKTAYRVDIAYALSLVDGKMVDENLKISYQVNLEENLKKILEPFGLTYKKRHASYIIIRKEEPKKTDRIAGLSASGNLRLLNEERRLLAERVITGTVRDAVTCEPLAGVSLTAKGTLQSVATDDEGRYSISVRSDSATLVFSFMGYAPRETSAGTKNAIDIELQTDVKK